MRSIFFHSAKSSPAPSMPSSSPSSTPIHHSFSETMMEDNIATAESIITKWDPDSSSYARITSLFYENRREAREFIRAVKDLQAAMHFYVQDNSTSHTSQLIHAQHLMQIAMKRLEKEFYQILASNRDHLDPESVSGRSSTATRSSVSDYEDDDAEEDDKSVRSAGASIQEVEQEASVAMADLRSIAECMTQSGYGKECVKIYKIMRKSIVDEGLYRLGFDRTSPQHLHKLDWELIELKIKNWLNTAKIAVKTLFFSERLLCDHVFASSDAIRESCFADITKDAAVALFRFPESFAVKCKKSPEKMFCFLDMYDTISELWTDIESIFSHELTSAVRLQTTASFVKVGEAVRYTLADFESAIQKDISRSPVPSGGLHPLTRYVMNYVCFLGDYSGILADIFADYPIQVQNTVPETWLEDNPVSAIAARLEWLILVLLCKLDGKAELYKDVGLSYLFLANNLRYVVTKVSGCDLRFLLGEEWLMRHESKVRQYASNYERMAWANVIQSLPPNPTADLPFVAAKDAFQRFNSAFEAAYRTQTTWIVPDIRLRDDIKLSIANKIMPAYQAFYGKYRVLLRDERHVEIFVKFAPEDLENYLSDLFYGSGSSVSGSASVSVSASPVHHSRGSSSR